MTPAKFRRVWAEISRFFLVEGDKITNPPLTKERKKASEKKVRSALLPDVRAGKLRH